MYFSELAERLEQLSQEDSRNEMMRLLATLFSQVDSNEIKPVCYLCLGRLAPLFNRVEFNLADKMVLRSIALASNQTIDAVLKLYKDKGDLGTVIEEFKSQTSNITSTTHTSKSSVVEVYEQLLLIAEDRGQGSQERKVRRLAAVLSQLEPLSGKYVVRIVLGKLRMGFSDKTILDALSMMAVGDKGARTALDDAYQLYPDVGELAYIVKQGGIEDLEQHVEVTLGVPVLPALAQRLKSAEEMIAKMGKVMVEPKYDGTRVQIHFSRSINPSTIGQQAAVRLAQDDTSELESISDVSNKQKGFLKTFTRNLDETTHMFPELQQIAKQIKAESVILDSEAIGYDPQTGALLPFQMTITRKRKHNVSFAQSEVPLRFFVYDLLYLDGKSLVHTPFWERRALLEKVVRAGAVLELAPQIVTEDVQALKTYHRQQLELGFEGALVKKIDAPYRSGRRGWSWVKFKEVAEATGKLADTVDVVVLGYYRGKGKRTHFGIGAFLVGVPRKQEGTWLTVAKVGTGLTDVQWQDLKERLEQLIVREKPTGFVVDESLRCDVWVEPELVVEVAADEITKSPTHSTGWALRFPRLVRVRDDKSAIEATTQEELEEIRNAS